MMKKLILAAFLPLAAFAQTKTPEITIYGSSHVPLELPKVGASVSMITAEEIEAQGVKSMAEALRLLPSTHVSQSGGTGGLTSIRLRGGESRHTLVVVDGISMNDLGDNAVNFSQFSVADIERIEVVRGPQSGVHGAQAHSGVIVITTKSGKGFKKPELEANFEHGSLNTQNMSLSARGQKDNVNAAISVYGGRTSGYNIAPVGDERDGSSNYGFTSRIGVQLTDVLALDTLFRRTVKNTQFDSTVFTPFLEDNNNKLVTTSTIARVGLTYKALEGRWVHSLSTDFSLGKTNSYKDDAPNFNSETQKYGFTYKSNYAFEAYGAKHRFVSGFDLKKEAYQYNPYASPTWIHDQTRTQKALFGEFLSDFKSGTSVSLALRKEFHSHFEDNLTYRATLSQQIGKTGGKLHGSYGKGVTTPNFLDIFGFNAADQFYKQIGNSALKPEVTIGYDIGYEQSLLAGKLVLDATFFKKRFQNEFTYPGNFNLATFIFEYQAQNATGSTYREGVELSARAIPLDWLTLTANYTYLRGVDSTWQMPVRRPNHSLNLTANARFLNDKANLMVGLNYNGKMTDTSSDPVTFDPIRVPLKAYTKLSANLSYDVNKNTTAYIRGENLLNQGHQEIFSYRGAPMEVFAGLKVKFQ
jgi:vitamin B12 transporter